MAAIFLSHSSKDKRFARRLAKDLEAKGVSVWIDEAEMTPGASLLQELEHAIKSSSYLGVILSPNSAESEWVQKEVEIAMVEEIQGKKVKVIPIMYKPCVVPGFLAGKVWAEFSKPKSYQNGLDSLLRRLTTDLMLAHTVTLEEHGRAKGDDSSEWSPKAVRLGVEYGLLQVENGSIQFSEAFVESYCHQAKKLVSENWTGFVEEGLIWLHIMAAGTAKKVEAHVDEFTYFLSEASSLPFSTYVMRIGYNANLLVQQSDESFRPSDEFRDEFFELIAKKLKVNDVDSAESADRFVFDALRELVHARLMLWAPDYLNHTELLALLLYSAWEFREIVRRALDDMKRDKKNLYNLYNLPDK